jgi:hypothetical protein
LLKIVTEGISLWHFHVYMYFEEHTPGILRTLSIGTIWCFLMTKFMHYWYEYHRKCVVSFSVTHIRNPWCQFILFLVTLTLIIWQR